MNDIADLRKNSTRFASFMLYVKKPLMLAPHLHPSDYIFLNSSVLVPNLCSNNFVNVAYTSLP